MTQSHLKSSFLNKTNQLWRNVHLTCGLLNKDNEGLELALMRERCLALGQPVQFLAVVLPHLSPQHHKLNAKQAWGKSLCRLNCIWCIQGKQIKTTKKLGWWGGPGNCKPIWQACHSGHRCCSYMKAMAPKALIGETLSSRTIPDQVWRRAMGAIIAWLEIKQRSGFAKRKYSCMAITAQRWMISASYGKRLLVPEK